MISGSQITLANAHPTRGRVSSTIFYKEGSGIGLKVSECAPIGPYFEGSGSNPTGHKTLPRDVPPGKMTCLQFFCGKVSTLKIWESKKMCKIRRDFGQIQSLTADIPGSDQSIKNRNSS